MSIVLPAMIVIATLNMAPQVPSKLNDLSLILAKPNVSLTITKALPFRIDVIKALLFRPKAVQHSCKALRWALIVLKTLNKVSS